MTRSNRKVCNEWSESGERDSLIICEECESKCIQKGSNKYICPRCGLIQPHPSIQPD
jgi:tRNA(Ile2) C34 agmatinyltransferase TiaS